MIYLDNAGTTKPYKEVLDLFNKVNEVNYFNPSASYSSSFLLSKEIDNARNKLIKFLGGEEEGKIIFTSGATESNNLAIFGSATNKNKKYLFSMGEHPSVFNCANNLKMKGYNVCFIPLQKNGQIDYKKFEELCTNDVCFVSTMFVNNETGAVNDLKRIRKIIDNNTSQCVFHVDAVQGFGKLALNLQESGINLCSLSAHKIGGIKGVGALYIAKNNRIKNINYGGGQEFNLRSGTVNAAGILSFLKAVEITLGNRELNYNKVLELKNYLIKNINSINNNNIIIVSDENTSPYVVSLLFTNNRGENIMRFLDSRGVLVGTGSACSSSKVGNRILENMGYTKNQIMGAIRVSFGFNNTKEDVDKFIIALKECMSIMNI